MKKLLAGIIAALILINTICINVFAESLPSEEKPLLAFPVISDIHCGNIENDARFEKALKDLKGINANYDALAIVGDMTCSGEQSEYSRMREIMNSAGSSTHLVPQNAKVMYAMGNHEYCRYMWYPGETEEMSQRRFVANTCMDGIYYDKWVNGYHFIFLSSERYMQTEPRPRDNGYFSDEQFRWLEEKLTENNYENRPIFLFLHQAVPDTVTGSDKDYNTMVKEQAEILKGILDKYPNVFLFTGHSHYDLNLPGNMYQDKFSTFNTSSVAYVLKEGPDGDDISAGDKLSQGLYVETYKDRVVVRSREFSTGSWIDEKAYTISLPAASNPEDQKPVWPSGSKLRIMNTEENKLLLKWPDAIDDIAVDSYVLYMDDSEIAVLPRETTLYEVKNIQQDKTHVFKVVAVDSYGNSSEELVADNLSNMDNRKITLQASGLKDINGNDVRDLKSRQLVGSEIKVRNNNDTESVKTFIIAAVCDNKGNYKNVSYMYCELRPNESKRLETGFNLPANVNGCDIKLFASSSLKMVDFISNAVEIPIN